MEKELTDALNGFYQQLLKPELDSIKGKMAEHDERFADLLGRLQALSDLLGRLDGSLTASALIRKTESSEIDPEIRAMLERND